jgi:hypothetical protein
MALPACLASSPRYTLAINPTDESSSPRLRNSLLSELTKVVFTLVLTGLIGGGITYYYQDRSQRQQQEAKDLETARNSALTFLREVGEILEQRRAASLRVLYAIRDHASPEETEQLWQDYLKTVNAWNVKWNLYRALVLEEFGPDMQKRFYDDQGDAEGVWARASITAKLIMFHNMLSDYHSPSPDKPASDPKQIEQLHSSIAQDCYAFYFEVINRIQEGKVGRRSWATAEKTK